MSSLIRRVTDRFTPNASSTDLAATKPGPDGFLTAKGTDALFPRTKEEIDGEECLHDCETCTIHLPRGFKIDEDDELFGQIKGFSRHLIVATGKTDWVRDVADEKGSLMEAVEAHGKDVEGGRLMLSASNMNLPDHNSGPYGKDRPTTVLLMPAFQFVDNVTPNRVGDLIRGVINKTATITTPFPESKPTNGSTTQNGDAESPMNGTPLSPSDLPSDLSLRNCPHKYVILMCSQATRDARCGQSAPLLKRELERHLRPLGLFRDSDDQRPGGVGIYFISHVGGHKYSANVMVYRKGEPARSVQEQMGNGANGGGKGIVEGEAAQCIWLARVKPEDCENIVRFTVLQGKVVKPESQLRGGFDREKGVKGHRLEFHMPSISSRTLVTVNKPSSLNLIPRQQGTMDLTLIYHLTESGSRCETLTDDEGPSHPNITCFTATIDDPALSEYSIGTLKAQLIHKSAIELSGHGIQDQCPAYDAAHAPGSKLEKVENYLSNESFFYEEGKLAKEAEWVLLIETAVLEQEFRGNGLGLRAMERLIEVLGMKGQKCIVILEPGPVGGVVGEVGVERAGEAIGMHWKKKGFREWSYTDTAWLCLSTVAEPTVPEAAEDV